MGREGSRGRRGRGHGAGQARREVRTALGTLLLPQMRGEHAGEAGKPGPWAQNWVALMEDAAGGCAAACCGHPGAMQAGLGRSVRGDPQSVFRPLPADSRASECGDERLAGAEMHGGKNGSVQPCQKDAVAVWVEAGEGLRWPVEELSRDGPCSRSSRTGAPSFAFATRRTSQPPRPQPCLALPGAACVVCLLATCYAIAARDAANTHHSIACALGWAAHVPVGWRTCRPNPINIYPVACPRSTAKSLLWPLRTACVSARRLCTSKIPHAHTSSGSSCAPFRPVIAGLKS